MEVAGLIELILARRLQTRREVPRAIQLARAVESGRAVSPIPTHGLADHLASMSAVLDERQAWEEQVLFPMLIGDGSPRRAILTRRMLAQHDVTAAQLECLRRLANGFAVPPGSGEAWWTLMRACRKLDCDLREHMRLEARLGAAFPYDLSSGVATAGGALAATSHARRPGEAAAGPRARRRSRSVGPPIGTAGGACGGLDRLRLGLARSARSRSPTPAASSVPTEAPRPN